MYVSLVCLLNTVMQVRQEAQHVTLHDQHNVPAGQCISTSEFSCSCCSGSSSSAEALCALLDADRAAVELFVQHGGITALQASHW